MPTRKPRTPSYRLHKPTGQAVVTLNGRDHYLGKHGTEQSHAAYERTISEWLANRRAHVGPVLAGITVSEVLAPYLRFANEYYRKDGRPTSEIHGIAQAIRPLKKLYGRTPAAEFGPQRMKAVRQALVDHGLCRHVVNQATGRVRRIFKWAVEHEFVPPSVYHGLLAVPGLKRGRCEAAETEPVRPVPDKYVDALKPYVSKQVWAIIELQRLTGMRSGEVLIMRGCDLEMTGELWLYTPSSHKTEHHGHSRVIEIGPKAQKIIEPFLKQNLQAFLFSPADAVEDQRVEKRKRRKSRVQPSQRDRSRRNPKLKPGIRYTTDSYRRAIARACEKAFPVPDEIATDAGKAGTWRKAHSWHPHQLRHNYATRIRKEYGVEAARILLGHRSAIVTELYAEIDRGRVRDIVAKVG